MTEVDRVAPEKEDRSLDALLKVLEEHATYLEQQAMKWDGTTDPATARGASHDWNHGLWIRERLAEWAPAMSATDDAGNLDRNHYDWFYPKAADVADPQWRADTRAKLTEALTDPFVHDAAKVTLAILDACEALLGLEAKFHATADRAHALGNEQDQDDREHVRSAAVSNWERARAFDDCGDAIAACLTEENPGEESNDTER